MRYINRRRFPARYRRSGGGKKGRRIFFALAAAAALWLAVSEIGLSSISEELTQEAARGYLLASINRAVEEQLREGESSFVAVGRDESGQVSQVSADAGELNRLKSGVLSRLERLLDGRVTAYVPIGSLTNLGILNGRGPKVPVRLKLEGSADAEFQTEFVSAGVNQSCHRITMTVTARAYSQSKRFEAEVEESTATVLAETVVVGRVPQVALGLTG